jgi:hypothetical protein
MGIDRIVDLDIPEPQHASTVLRILRACWTRFGMKTAASSDDCGIAFKLGKFRLSIYPPNAGLDMWVRSEHPNVDSLIDQLLVEKSSNEWHAHFVLADSKNRYFASVSAGGAPLDKMTSLRLWMRRSGLLLFSDRDKDPPDVDRFMWVFEKEKIEFVRKWERHEQELIELERQEYHFMRTLFDMLPQAVALDLYVADPDLDDPVSYCFTRTEARATSHFKEKRLPEFEQWCDEHEPEYWQQFKPPSAT